MHPTLTRLRRRLRRRHLLGSDDFDGHLDVPAPGAEINDNLLTVRGWAVMGGAAPSRVEIEVDGVSVGRARLRLYRADVEALGLGPGGAFSGFEFYEPLPQSSAATAVVTVTATGMLGQRAVVGQGEVRRGAASTSADDSARGEVLRRRTAAALPPDLRAVGVRRNALRLLVFTHQLSLGGGQLYLQDLLRQLVSTVGSCVVVSPSDGVLHGGLEEFGAEVVITGRSAPNAVETYEGHVREMSMLIRGSRCDVVLVNTLTELPAADAAQRLGVPVVWAIHESYEIEAWLAVFYGARGWHPYVADRMRAALGGVNRLIFEAAATDRMFARYAAADRRLVVPYGVDTDGLVAFAASFDRAAGRAARGLAENAVVLLVVGQVEERKSQAALVEAFVEVAADHPDAVLVMVGDFPGPYSAGLHRQLEVHGMGERVRLLPPTAAIREWYAVSDVLVSASDLESLPRSMLEAMALGVPILSAEVFGIPELISDGVNGWLFPPRDMAALSQALRRVLDAAPSERARLGTAARETVLERYRWSGYARVYSELIDELAAPGTAASSASDSQALDRVDRALEALAASARAAVTLDPPQADAGLRLSRRLTGFNSEAPHVRNGIAEFVARAAQTVAAGSRVADVGAGDAPYRELFAHVEYLTIDWENSMHGDSKSSDIVASAEELPLPDASIDAVVMTEVLEHIGKPARALAQVARILRPGGRLFMTTPFAWFLHEMPYDYFRYTPSALRMLVEDAGFVDVVITARGDSFATIGQLMSTVREVVATAAPAEDPLNARRELAGRLLDQMSRAVAALSPLDLDRCLPLGFNVEATLSSEVSAS